MPINRILKEASNVIYQGSVAGKTTSTETQLEYAYNSTLGYGKIGDDTKTLCDIAGVSGVPLQAGAHFQYDKRLDASTSEDASYGFGSTAGGIYDTLASGSLVKSFRIVENSKNIKDVTGLNLKVMAKQMANTNSLIFPPSDYCYVDPISRLFTLPRPIYWSKCESLAGITTGEIGTATQTLTSTPTFYYPVGKFGNCQHIVAPNIATTYGTGTTIQTPTLTKGTLSYWIRQDDTSNAGYISNSVYMGSHYITAITSGTQPFWRVVRNDNTVLQGMTQTELGLSYFLASWKHIYVVWDNAGGLSGGKTIRAFVNGVYELSTTEVTTNSSFYIWTSVYANAGGTIANNIDNIKVWDYVVSENPAWEYNSGTGRELALHFRYGSSNNYQPILAASGSGVGYNGKSGSANAPIVITGSGTNVSPTAEAVTLSGSSGLFGTNGGMLNTDAYQFPTFTYDKRLDSTLDGGVDIYDTGISGSLAAGKYFRIVNNGVNAKSLTGITQVVAKNLSSYQSPPSNTIYVDPTTGKYIMPGPVYWSKCDSLVGITAGEIGTAVISGTTPIIRTGGYAKFGGWVGFYLNEGSSAFTYITPNISFINSGMASFYSLNYAVTSICRVLAGIQTPIGCISTDVGNQSGGGFCGITLTSTPMGTQYATTGSILSTNVFNHIFIVWDINKSLSSGKSFIIYLNGVEVLSSTSTFTSNNNPAYFYMNTSPNVSNTVIGLDNLKIWNNIANYSDVLAMEYNSGTGRELALHPLYGLTDGYVPLNNTVGYFRSGYINNLAKIYLSR